MTSPQAANRLRELGAKISGDDGTRGPVDVTCTCGFRWCDLPYEDLPRALADVARCPEH